MMTAGEENGRGSTTRTRGDSRGRQDGASTGSRWRDGQQTRGRIRHQASEGRRLRGACDADDRAAASATAADDQQPSRRVRLVRTVALHQRRPAAAVGSGDRQRPDSGSAAAAALARRLHDSGSDGGAVNGAEQLCDGALSDRSILDEGCDSTRFDDVRLRMDFKVHGEVMLSNLVVI
ncbi:hypothetical protein Scep_024259 [Stephania cephalantha]|uniref:Uncharacterized protein n=1 Tax=Stephania cephalantha TaxID=152367 RepID=A0AAP0HY86_9MAGN